MILARGPAHLGDAIQALPALTALAAMGPLDLQAGRWGPELFRDLSARVLPFGPAPAGAYRVAVVFSPAVGAAWAVRRVPERIGVGRAVGVPGVPHADLRWRRPLLTRTVDEATHQAETYNRLARAAGAHPQGVPAWQVRDGDPTPAVPRGHVGLNPVARGGDTRHWRGFALLAARLQAYGIPVVWYGGPGEESAVAAAAACSGDAPRWVGLPLSAFGAALARCAAFVSVDTGAAHFARAVGAPTVVVHTSTSAARTGPAGAFAVEPAPLSCWPCYRPRCAIGTPCASVPLSRVWEALAQVRGGWAT